MIFPQGYLLKFLPQRDTSARQRGFEIRVIPLLGELPKAIEPHLPVCQLYRWQLGPTMWSSSTTKSLDLIVVTTLWVDFPWESLGSATGGFACNSLVPEAWTTEAAGYQYHHVIFQAVPISTCNVQVSTSIIMQYCSQYQYHHVMFQSVLTSACNVPVSANINKQCSSQCQYQQVMYQSESIPTSTCNVPVSANINMSCSNQCQYQHVMFQSLQIPT